MNLTLLSHIDLTDGSHLYVQDGRWIQCYEAESNGGADLGPVGDEIDAGELCHRLNCAKPSSVEIVAIPHRLPAAIWRVTPGKSQDPT